MKAWPGLWLLPALLLPLPLSAGECPAALDFHLRSLSEPRTIHLCEQYRDKVVLIVNTASKCAFTPRYAGLEALYARYRSQGLVVLGFPSNDFAHQEPGSEAEIRTFCRLTYGCSFPCSPRPGCVKPMPIRFMLIWGGPRGSSRNGIFINTCWIAGGGWWPVIPHRWAPMRRR